MKIYSYILKAHAAPFFLSFFIIIFVFTFQFLMKFIDNLVGKGLSWWVIAQLIMLNLAWMVTLAGPMAVLVATLMAFGSLSSSNETTIIQSAGISLFRMIAPVLLVSGALCYGLILFNNRVLPEANHRTKVLMNDIQKTRPTFAIEPGRFTDDIGGYNLLVDKIFYETNRLKGVYIIDNSSPNYTNILTASDGEITFSGDQSKIILDLYTGEIHQLNKKNWYADYRKIIFTKHIVTIDAHGFVFSKTDEEALSRGDRELSADSMRNIVNSMRSSYEKEEANSLEQAKLLALDFPKVKYTLPPDTVLRAQTELYVQTLMNRYKGIRLKLLGQKKTQESTQRQVNSYLVEIYKKYSIPFACIVFVLIGAPLGLLIRRGGFGVAAGMSLGFFLVYWACLIGGEKLADRQIMSPLLSMWGANFLLGAAGLFLVLRQVLNQKRISRIFRL